MAQRLPVLYNKKPCYDIVFQQSFDGLWEELQELGASEKKLCIVTDSRVDELYGAQVAELLEGKCRKIVKYAFPAGEENKNLETVKDVYRYLIEEGFDRKDMLLALGGGVTGEALLGIWPVSLQRLIFEALILFKFRQHCSHRWTAALAVRQAWILTVIRIWSALLKCPDWYI